MAKLSLLNRNEPVLRLLRICRKGLISVGRQRADQMQSNDDPDKCVCTTQAVAPEPKSHLGKAGAYLWREWLRPAALIAVIVFPLKSAVADWNWVPSGSMKPTILEGDLILVNKLAYDL